MRVERLVIEAGSSTFTLDLHPRLTVVAGMGRIERHSLVAELVSALAGSRPGVHIDVERRDGRHLAVFRPTAGEQRVVNVLDGTDLTRELTGADGACDLLAPLGLTAAAARDVMCLDSGALTADSNRGHAVEALAVLEQDELWAAADELVRSEDLLVSQAAALGSAPEDAAVIDVVQSRHVSGEAAASRSTGGRGRMVWLSGASAAATVPALVVLGPVGLAFGGLAGGAAAVSLLSRARLGRAADAQEQAVADTCAAGYLGFQAQRVNDLLGDEHSRKVLISAAEARRAALAAWRQMAGDIPVAWALDHREEVQAAARLRREVDALGAISTTAPHLDEDTAGDLAHVLISRLAAARSVGGEGLPLILDDPFREVDPSVKPLLLELLGRSAGRPQVVFLTDDEDVASWARLEALTSEVALIEPTNVSEQSRPDAAHGGSETLVGGRSA